MEPEMTSNKTRRRTDSPRSPNELKQGLNDAETKFVEAMRRPPRSNDRIFYWSYCYSDAEFKEMMIKTMLQADIPQHLIHIYDKTGFMVNEHGYKRLSKEEREEIRDANVE